MFLNRCSGLTPFASFPILPVYASARVLHEWLATKQV